MNAHVLGSARSLERLLNLGDVQPEALPLGVDAGCEKQMIGAERESHALGDGEPAKIALDNLRVVFRRDVGIQLLLLLTRFAAGDDVLGDHFDALVKGVVRVGPEPRICEPLLERVRAAEIAEDDVELTDDELEELDLLIEESKHVRFDRIARGEVDDVRLTSLTDAVDAPDALLDDHRIPRQLVVHQAMAELQVESLGAGARRDEDRRRIFFEGGELLCALIQ